MTIQPLLALAWNPAVGVPMAIVGLIILAALWLFGQPKKEQGVRRPGSRRGDDRRDPTFGEEDEEGEPSFSALEPPLAPAPGERRSPPQGELDMDLREELERLGAALADERGHAPRPPAARPAVSSRLSSTAASIINTLRAPHGEEEPAAAMPPAAPLPSAPVAGDPLAAAAPAPAEPVEPPRVYAPAPAFAASPTPAPAPAPVAPPRSEIGRRPAQLPVERIVSLFVVARAGEAFIGADLVVAAEKAGLEFGDMGIYHRMLDGKPEAGPIFSVANMVKPGNFDLSRIDALRTPGLSFFMTLPAPIAALDAWEAMLPTAQRLAELLDGHVLDEERNALGRQRIAHIRDELRGWDRDHEGERIIFGR